MTKVSYFAKYSQGENQVTNNVLLMLNHLYNESPKLFKQFLDILINDDNLSEKIDVGIHFNQQEKGSDSIPDGHISQTPFSLYIEAKIGNEIIESQMERHIETIRKNETQNNILLSLTNNHLGWVENTFHDSDINIKSITYNEIVNSLKAVIPTWQINLLEILEDFESYLHGKGLMLTEHQMLAIACGTSYKENIKHNIYFCQEYRNIRPNTNYIGIYNKKNISHIGKIETIVVHDKGEKWWYKNQDGTPVANKEVTLEHQNRVLAIIEDADYYDLKNGREQYFLLNELHEVNLKKESDHGLQSRKYFDLEKDFKEDLGSGLSFEEICDEIRGSKWE